MRLASLFIILIIFCLISISFSQSAYVDYEHWIYEFIQKMDTRGLFTRFDAGMKPYSRVEIAKILVQIDRQSRSNPRLLSASEKGMLEQFKGEFHDELADSGLQINPRFFERHTLKWQEKQHRIYIDFTFDQKLDFRSGDQFETAERQAETTLGAVLRGEFHPNFSFYMYVTNTRSSVDDSTGEHFDPAQGQPVVTTGSSAFSDKAVAYLNWRLPWFSLKLGRDRIKWGPGYRGGLTLSQNNPLFDMILLQTRFNRFNFQYFHGFLNSPFEQKYLIGHRVELKAADWLYLAGTETLIYGNRGIEMQYLNPLMPYHVAEHHLGDKDNNMMSFEISAFPKKNQKYYAELLLDDFSSSENWLKYIGNKFGILVGGYWAAPLGLQNADLRFEYTRIEPFVYTHYDSVNIYMNYDQSIGYWAGPNSDDLLLEMNYWLYRSVHLRLALEQVRRGSGNLYRFPTKADGTTKEFLSGVVERQRILAFQIRDQLFKDVFLAFQATLVQTQNVGKITGVDALDKYFSFHLSVNY